MLALHEVIHRGVGACDHRPWEKALLPPVLGWVGTGYPGYSNRARSSSKSAIKKPITPAHSTEVIQSLHEAPNTIFRKA
jgi:hypothetical protein